MMRHHQQFKMAADKPEAVHIVYSVCHIELHIDFDEITGQSILHCDGDPWKHGSCIWNQVSTCDGPKLLLLPFSRPPYLFTYMVIPKIDLTLIPLGRRDLIMSKSAEKRWFLQQTPRYKHFRFPTFRPPSWICSWKTRFTKSPIPQLKSLTPKIRG